MGNLGHQAARLAASKICDNIVKRTLQGPGDRGCKAHRHVAEIHGR